MFIVFILLTLSSIFIYFKITHKQVHYFIVLIIRLFINLIVYIRSFVHPIAIIILNLNKLYLKRFCIFTTKLCLANPNFRKFEKHNHLFFYQIRTILHSDYTDEHEIYIFKISWTNTNFFKRYPALYVQKHQNFDKNDFKHFGNLFIN